MDKTFTFKFSEQEANLILNALAELPFKTVSTLIQKIIESAKTQQEPPTPKVVAEAV